MFKKALISSAVASLLLFSAGCEVSSVEDNDKVDKSFLTGSESPESSPYRQGTHPLFTLVSSSARLLPIASDLLFSAAASTDGTAATEDNKPPVTTAINDLDGFSLTAPIDIPFNGPLLPASVSSDSIVLLELFNSPEVDALDLEAIKEASDGTFFVETEKQLQGGVDYSVSLTNQGGVPVARIELLKPLKPATKYLVIVTDFVRDVDGKQIVPSEDFQILSQFTPEAPAEGSLGGANRAVKAWGKLAASVLKSKSQGALGLDNVALSIAFTTGGADTVLKAMAAPVTHLQSAQLVGGAIQAGALNPPKSRPFQIIKDAQGEPFSLTPSQVIPNSLDSITRYVQGGLTIPVGLNAPMLTDIPALLGGDKSAISKSLAGDSIWRGNTALGTIIDKLKQQEAGTTPPKDSDSTINVTYRYPHAALNQTQTVPVLITLPGDYSGIGKPNCLQAKPWKVAIFVHGITSDRTSSVGIGNALATSCIATVAMDLPMHGVAPLRTHNDGNLIVNSAKIFNAEQDSAGYPFGLAAKAAGIMINERHYNIGTNPATSVARVPMDFVGDTVSELSGTSGAHYINLFNFQRTRDNMRQAVVDLMNLAASIGDMDVDGDRVADFDSGNIHLIGHSLGAILSTTFASVINDAEVQAANANLPKLNTVILGNPGTQLTKLLENSPAFASTIIGALKNAGINQGSTSYESFFQAFQATIASADPVNFAKNLAETSTPILLYSMVGGGDIGDDKPAIPSAFVQAFANKYPPDHVVPNYDYFKDASNPYAFMSQAPGSVLPAQQATAQAPLAGTNPLIKLMGLTEINAGSSSITGSDPLKAAVIIQKGTHGTFAGADARPTFEEIVKQMTFFISSGGTSLPVDNTNDIYAPAADQ